MKCPKCGGELEFVGNVFEFLESIWRCIKCGVFIRREEAD